MRYIMFSKHLQTMSVAEAGQTIESLGFSGVELTVRPGGHVLPDNVAEDLPRAVEELRAAGLETPAIVVEIHNRQQEFSEAVCRAASKVGARELRTSSHRYRGFGEIREQIAAARKDAKELEALGREHGVRLCIHCHSGDFLSGQGGILAMITDETDPRYVGVSLDVGHLTTEGGKSGWKQSIDLLKDRVGIVAVKSFGWFHESDPKTGEKRWNAKLVPLAEGNVQWKLAFQLLRQGGWDVDGNALVSVHSEYQGGGSWKNLDVPELIDQTRADFTYLKEQAAA
ncbi:MAG TPA: sugar phosphate isomerase/epimerase [Chloroflexota bacterium]|jgi:sugar phosphate isomerase/epimerase|nr:sugar phosphate isomerase/epimerase [Chloroflexota bacterium]